MTGRNKQSLWFSQEDLGLPLITLVRMRRSRNGTISFTG